MITTSRSQLYREIWAEPVRTVAARYQISDVALAKLCRRHNIPLPPRGHWAKVRAGQHPKRPHLKPLPGDSSPQITIQGNPKPPEALTDETARLIEAEDLEEAKIVVPDQLTDPHPDVARAAKSLHISRTDPHSVLTPRARPRLDIRVYQASLDRALRIMDALVKGLEARGYQVEVDDDEPKHSTSAILLDERVFFFLEEKTKRADHEPTAAEKLEAKRWNWERWPKHDFLPSGALRLRIVDTDYLRVRTVWSDGESQRIEDCLNDFIVGLLKAAEAIKRRRVEHAKAEKRRREEAILQAELDQLRWLEEARRRELDRQADASEKARRIRAYVDRAREAGLVCLPDTVKIDSLQQWLDWATRYANAVDPFRPKEVE